MLQSRSYPPARGLATRTHRCIQNAFVNTCTVATLSYSMFFRFIRQRHMLKFIRRSFRNPKRLPNTTASRLYLCLLHLHMHNSCECCSCLCSFYPLRLIFLVRYTRQLLIPPSVDKIGLAITCRSSCRYFCGT
jgi:hypothetical protein